MIHGHELRHTLDSSVKKNSKKALSDTQPSILLKLTSTTFTVINVHVQGGGEGRYHCSTSKRIKRRKPSVLKMQLRQSIHPAHYKKFIYKNELFNSFFVKKGQKISHVPYKQPKLIIYISIKRRKNAIVKFFRVPIGPSSLCSGGKSAKLFLSYAMHAYI